jgi:hypothetical protein
LRLEALNLAEKIGLFEMFVNGLESIRAFGMAGAVIVQKTGRVIKESGHNEFCFEIVTCKYKVVKSYIYSFETVYENPASKARIRH